MLDIVALETRRVELEIRHQLAAALLCTPQHQFELRDKALATQPPERQAIRTTNAVAVVAGFKSEADALCRSRARRSLILIFVEPAGMRLCILPTLSQLRGGF